MDTMLLSRHSSNPLEVPSSDVQNARYRRQYNRAREDRLGQASSDDPLDGYNPELEQYHNHLIQLFPNTAVAERITQQEEPPKVPEVQYSDDELQIIDEDVVMAQRDEEELQIVGEDGEGEGREDVEDDRRTVTGNHDDEDEDEEEEEDEIETDEETTIYCKPLAERGEIEEEIQDLEDAVPQLREDYKLIDRLGTGTFSSVYKAIDLGYHTRWYNGIWHGKHPPESSAYSQSVPKPPESKALVAIKRIYVTSNPERIRNEIAIMEDCRGCRHISQIITAFRHKDQVVIVLPYSKNEDFRDYFRTMSWNSVKAYFRCLLRALRDLHARSIIHRDVKPANFLFDSRTDMGTLCDFGLASRISPNLLNTKCLHTAASRAFPHGKIKPKDSFDSEHIKATQRWSRQQANWPSEKVGYPDKDMRPHSKANRAGTRGFRAPEVLFKCNDQTGAIDIWSAGVIMLSFLTGKYPIFNSNDDIEALMEIASIIGRRQMEKVATLHNRTFCTNVPSVTPEGMTWREFVERQNPDIIAQAAATSPPPTSSTFPDSDAPTHQPGSSSAEDPDHKASSSSSRAADIESAFDLLNKLLHSESVKRITARDALYHPFLYEEGNEDDDFVPHPQGQGVCGHLHFKDSVTEEHWIRGAMKEVGPTRKLSAGEGIPIGKRPCEYHTYVIDTTDLDL